MELHRAWTGSLVDGSVQANGALHYLQQSSTKLHTNPNRRQLKIHPHKQSHAFTKNTSGFSMHSKNRL